MLGASELQEKFLISICSLSDSDNYVSAGCSSDGITSRSFSSVYAMHFSCSIFVRFIISYHYLRPLVKHRGTPAHSTHASSIRNAYALISPSSATPFHHRLWLMVAKVVGHSYRRYLHASCLIHIRSSVQNEKKETNYRLKVMFWRNVGNRRYIQPKCQG